MNDKEMKTLVEIAKTSMKLKEFKIPIFADEFEYMKYQCNLANTSFGHLNEVDGVKCNKCLNRGYFEMIDAENKNIFIKECDCMKKRKSVRALHSSGLGAHLRNCSFDNFETPEEWQKSIKESAIRYANLDGNEWFYLSGQRGGGKTHLCTGICKRLIDKGRLVKYLLWSDISRKLDALKFRDEEYEIYMNEIKNADVLYIDDFLKNCLNDYAEIKKAYIIVNARDLMQKRTIISSETGLVELENIDSAISGRIRKNSKSIYNTLYITPKEGRDYRKKLQVEF